MNELEWPYNLPIWRRSHYATSPDGQFRASIDPAYEASMGNPTSGTLCVSVGLHIDRCNPSFIWSDDSRYLVVPQFYERLGFFQRQRILVADVHSRRAYVSRARAFYFQPESFDDGRLVVVVEPARRAVSIRFEVPHDIPSAFEYFPWARWTPGLG